MRTNRRERGFTMVEMVAAIAILVISFALIFVGVAQYQKSMFQKEMDGYAKEIYVAAQNHLSIAKSQGLLDSTATTFGDSPAGGWEWAGGDADVYYYILPAVAADKVAFNDKTSALSLMLPYGSIDDTVRMNGSYVIRYQYDQAKDIAAVLDVFYTQPDGGFLLSRFGGSFDDLPDTYRDLEGYAGVAASSKRLDYHSSVIGWYGGASAGGFEVKNTDKLSVKVENVERLTVVIEMREDLYQESSGNGSSLTVRVTGATSGAYQDYPSPPALVSGLQATKITTTGREFKVYLDDVTESGRHFTDLFSLTEGFIPGEDIRVQAFVLASADGKEIEASNTETVNSLFDSVATVKDEHGSPRQVAFISNIRHLENLSYAVSGYNPLDLPVEDMYGNAYVNPRGDGDTTLAEDWKGFAAQDAQQVANLSWPEFRRAIAGDDATEDDANKVSAVKLDGTAAKEGCFIPVNATVPDASTGAFTTFPLAYEGNRYAIEGIKVEADSGPAGVFGTVTGGSIRNLELVNFNVTTAAGNAGALAGTLTDTTVSGVLAHNQVSGGGSGSPYLDSGYRISGSGDVGGLVGSISGGSIDKSAAAVFVKSTGGGNAGGLVGSAAASIRDSYSGGHTVNGEYRQGTDDWNVQSESGGNAGGLVGSTSGLIQRCYSTCSAYGAVAGGLVGVANPGASVQDSYALGLVGGTSDSATKGALVGRNDSEEAFFRNHYLRLINGKDDDGNYLNPVGRGADDAGAAAIDRNAEDFNAFTRLGKDDAALASPYDGTLVQNYRDGDTVRYLYQSIKHLNGGSGDLTLHLKMHFGDWPAPETLIVNTRP